MYLLDTTDLLLGSAALVKVMEFCCFDLQMQRLQFSFGMSQGPRQMANAPIAYVYYILYIYAIFMNIYYMCIYAICKYIICQYVYILCTCNCPP